MEMNQTEMHLKIRKVNSQHKYERFKNNYIHNRSGNFGNIKQHCFEDQSIKEHSKLVLTILMLIY